MGFRFRLASFLVATLASVQALTAVLVYEVTRHELIAEGERQLAAAGGAFERQLDDISERVADNVQVLALDYALRGAIAQRDQETVLSALRNHGRRVGATRMMLIDLNGGIEVDTAEAAPAGRVFAFTDLLNSGFERPSAALVAMDGRAYWMVVVPVVAPTLVGLIAAAIPIDDELLAKLQQQSALPKDIELATESGDGSWRVVARGNANLALTNQVLAANRSLPTTPILVDVAGLEYVALSIPLHRSQQSAPVAAVLGYSLDEALRPYRSVATSWATLLALGLGVGLIGALLIARGVSRPVELLAEHARRIEAGDYGSPPPIRRSDEIGELAAAFTNMAHAIGEREERIRYQAGHDAVTGLPNRQMAETAIQQMLAQRGGQSGALLMIGLARLPEIIKTMGHAICDRLMRDAGARIRQPAANGLIARATDTEFSIWLPGAEKAEAIALAFRVIDTLGEPYQESDLAIDMAPAVGIALSPAHGAQASALLQHAEVALFAALGSEDPVVVYDPTTDPHRPERLSLMGDLREALDSGQLHLHYQPKLNLATGLIDGAEALVRWQHPKYGALAPDAFIGLAEKTGNIRRLTRWVLATSIAQAQRWSAAGGSLRISVNLSVRDLDDTELPRRVDELLAVHGVAPQSIVLEITESAVMGEPDAAIRVLKRLADRGIELAIDDFGVGQSSFAYLHRLPVRELKIDKAFVHNLAEDGDNQTIVRSMVELGHRLGYRVTAEGVEQQSALDYLVTIGCDHAQGFHIAKAMPPDAFALFLEQSVWWPKR